jgi:hypothetical protein
LSNLQNVFAARGLVTLQKILLRTSKMSNFSGPLPLKTLRLEPLREEELMSTVGASTGGVKNSSGGGLHHLPHGGKPNGASEGRAS